MTQLVMVYKANAPVESLDIETARVKSELCVSKHPTPRIFLVVHDGSLDDLRANFPNWAIGPNQTYSLA